MKNMNIRYRITFTVAVIMAILISTFLGPALNAALKPNQPVNISPANGANGISLTHLFKASPFVDTI